MKNTCLTLACVLSFALLTFAQVKEARKIDEFGFLQCGHFMARADVAFQDYERVPNSKLYVIYYEGKGRQISVWNKKLRDYETKWQNPRRGSALNRAKEIVIYLKNARNLDEKNIILIDGGYREEFSQEIWIVPDGAKTPAPTPTLEEKDITFEKGKSRHSRDCSKAYDGY
ncbi:MAG TPA: hypothetical protein VF571_16910 [Pyrinomonadaceae bacterium]|jgi:hypothetical protein